MYPALGQKVEFDDSYRKHPLLKIADSLRSTEKWEQAIQAYEKAKQVTKEEENWPGYIYAINQAGYCYRRDRRLEEARQKFDFALSQGNELLGDYHPELGRIFYNLGFYYYYRNKYEEDLDSSYWAREKSIEINERSVPKSSVDLANSYHGMASLLNTEDYSNYFGAIQYYEKALELRLKALPPNHVDLGRTYLYLGYAYNNLDDPQRAEIYLNSALRIFEQSPSTPATLKYQVYNNLGNSFNKQDRFDEAIENFKKSIYIVSESYGPNNWRQVNRYNNRGIAYANLEAWDSAVMDIKTALRINLSDQDINFTGLGDSYSHLGFIFQNRNQFDSAEYYIRKSIDAFKSEPQADFRVSENHRMLAKIYFDLGQYNKAKIESLSALKATEPDIDILKDGPNQLKDPITAFYPIRLLARVQNKISKQTGSSEDFEMTLHYFNRVEQLKDLIRNQGFSNQAKYGISIQFQSSSAEYLAALARGDDEIAKDQENEMAYEIMERNRYGELFRNVVNAQKSSTLNVPDSLLQIEKLLASQISVYHRKLKSEEDTLKQEQTQYQLLRLEREYQNIKSLLSAEFPSYYKSKFGEELLSLTEVQSRLEPNQQVLEYFWGDSLITILSITSESSQLHRVPITAELEPQMLAFLSLVSTAPSSLSDKGELYTRYESISLDLYNKLVSPLLAPETNKLIVIPDGPISLIPFEALITSPGHPAFDGAPYLIHDLNIRYGYSCNLLFQKAEVSAEGKPNMLAFAYSNGGEELARLERTKESELPGTALELNSIKTIFKGKNHRFRFGDEATETAFKKYASDYEIIHLAVHGIGDTTNAFNSHLRFRDNQESDEDGSLFAHELYSLHLNDLILVVLSACESGVGKEYPGEGVFSMARGFRYAGAATTVMSLWDVNDESTSQLMGGFYKQLKKGQTVSESLREAKIEFLKTGNTQMSHPSYWAAFVGIGEDVRIMSPARIVPFAVIIIILALSIFSIRHVRRLRRNQKGRLSIP